MLLYNCTYLIYLNVRLQKISITTPRIVIENSYREGGVSIAIFFIESMKQNWKFQGRGEGWKGLNQIKNHTWGRYGDIAFWNHTISGTVLFKFFAPPMRQGLTLI